MGGIRAGSRRITEKAALQGRREMKGFELGHPWGDVRRTPEDNGVLV